LHIHVNCTFRIPVCYYYAIIYVTSYSVNVSSSEWRRCRPMWFVLLAFFKRSLALETLNRWQIKSFTPRNASDCALLGVCRWYVNCVVTQSELVDTAAQLKTSQEQLVKALADVSRVSDELVHSQQLQEQSDKQRKLLETQLKDAEAKLDSVQAEHLYTSKKIVEKLEQRVRVVQWSTCNFRLAA